MGIYNSDKKDYQELVRESIKKAQTLSQVAPEFYDEVNDLLNKKSAIIEENSLFANLKLKNIDKKISKLIIKSNKKSLES